jgi:multicomponent Na+:H+ antiporter subunit E
VGPYITRSFFIFNNITVHAASKFLILLAFWLCLSGQTDLTVSSDLYLIACGVLACALVTYIAFRNKILDREGNPIDITFRLFSYLPWLFWQIVLANLDVAYRVWHPKQKIAPRLIKVPFNTETDLGTMIYANSITLTPGTVTVSVDTEKAELLVHALSEEAAEGLLSGEMHERVRKLEGSA